MWNIVVLKSRPFKVLKSKDLQKVYVLLGRLQTNIIPSETYTNKTYLNLYNSYNTKSLLIN